MGVEVKPCMYVQLTFPFFVHVNFIAENEMFACSVLMEWQPEFGILFTVLFTQSAMFCLLYHVPVPSGSHSRASGNMVTVVPMNPKG